MFRKDFWEEPTEFTVRLIDAPANLVLAGGKPVYTATAQSESIKFSVDASGVKAADLITHPNPKIRITNGRGPDAPFSDLPLSVGQ